MAKTRVLVTGLSGVVGQAMQAELADRYELSSLSRYGTEGLDDAHNFRGNITDPDALQAAFRDQEVVVHLAADRSMKAPFESTVDYNITGLYNVYEAARRCGVRRIVFGSSQHTVGGFYRDPPYCHIFAGEFERVQRPYPLLDETVPIRPSGYYGMSKAYGEAMGPLLLRHLRHLHHRDPDRLHAVQQRPHLRRLGAVPVAQPPRHRADPCPRHRRTAGGGLHGGVRHLRQLLEDLFAGEGARGARLRTAG